MRIEIEKEWFENNKGVFAKLGDTDLSSEEKEYYVIDTDESTTRHLFTSDEINYDGGINDENGIYFTISNNGLYVSPPACAVDASDIETILSQGNVDMTIKAIGVITKKMNQIKSLLESAKAL